MICRMTHLKECESKYAYCEGCRVPNSFGWFFVLKGTKIMPERRFILERERREQIGHYKHEIKKAYAEIEKLKALPSANEYRRENSK